MPNSVNTEKLRSLLSLWSYALFAGPTNLFGLDAPTVYLEVGRVALQRLTEQGVDLVQGTPLDTVNAIYGYFVEQGFFEEAWAKPAMGSEIQKETYTFYEKNPIVHESNRWAFLSGECQSPACFCYSIMRYALIHRFGLDFKVLGEEVKEETREWSINVELVKGGTGAMKAMSLVEALGKGQAELTRISDLYRKTLDISLDAIVTSDETGRIILWNPAAERMFGYTKEEAMGMRVAELMPEEYREKHQNGFLKFIETQRPVLIGQTVEVAGLRKDGSRFFKEISLSADQVAGKWVFTGVMRDITERKRLENEVKKRLDEVERLNKLMVGRELKMEEMRKKIKDLEMQVASFKLQGK